MKQSEQHAFLAALQPGSLAICVITTLTGIRIAWLNGYENNLAYLIVIGAVMAQAGFNLLYHPGRLQQPQTLRAAFRFSRRSLQNTTLGWLFLVAAGWIVTRLLMLQGLPLFLLMALSGLFAFNDKFGALSPGLKGLFPGSFLLGMLTVQGAYIAMAGEPSIMALFFSIPLAFIIALLSLDNRVNDLPDAGSSVALRLYWALLTLACLAAVELFVFSDYLPERPAKLLWFLPALLVLPYLRRVMLEEPGARQRRLLTTRFALLFGLGFLLAMGY